MTRNVPPPSHKRSVVRPLLMACLVLLTLSALFIAYGVYLLGHAVQQYGPLVASYTCGAFRQDVESPDGNKPRAVAMATVAYGRADVSAQQTAARLEQEGVLPAVSRVYRLCEGQPETPVVGVLVARSISTTVSTTVSASTPNAVPTTIVSASVTH